MDIVFLRHGEAGARAGIPDQDDERSLTRSGRKEVMRVAESLRALDPTFDTIATSPLKRAFETAEIAAREFRRLSLLEKWDELRPTAETKDLYRRLARLKSTSKVLLVGHEPHMSIVIGDMISGDAGVSIILKKAGVARVRVASFKPKVSGELRLLITPKLLTKISG